VQKNYRDACRIAGLFDLNPVLAAGFQKKGVEWGNFREKGFHGLRKISIIKLGKNCGVTAKLRFELVNRIIYTLCGVNIIRKSLNIKKGRLDSLPFLQAMMGLLIRI